MAILDLTTASKILKEQFDTHDAYKVLVADDPLLGLMKREDGVLVGKNYKFAIQYGTGRGVSTTIAGARLSKTPNPYTDVLLNRGRLYGVGGIDRETMKIASKNKDSFVNSLEAEQDGILATMNERLSDWAYKNGGGACGKVAAGGISGAVITLTDIGDAQNVQAGTILQFSSTDGTTGAVEAGTVTVASVDRAAGTITCTGNVTAGVATAVAGMWIFPNQDHATSYADVGGNRVCVGIDGWIPLTAPGATLFFGINRSVDPVRLGGCRYTGAGRPIQETVTNALASFSQQGAKKVDTLIMSELRVAELANSLEGRVQYTTKTNEQTKLSFKGFDFVSPNGTVTVLGTPRCKQDRGYALEMATWRVLTTDGGPTMIDDDGLTIRRAVDQSDGYEFEMNVMLQIACNQPGKNGVFSF